MFSRLPFLMYCILISTWSAVHISKPVPFKSGFEALIVTNCGNNVTYNTNVTYDSRAVIRKK